MTILNKCSIMISNFNFKNIKFKGEIMFKFNRLKNLHQRFQHIKLQKKLLNSLNPGDLVWAKIPLPKKQLNKIEESYRIRHYLIMYRK